MDPHESATLRDLPILDGTYRLHVDVDDGPSSWTRVTDTCGSCSDEVHVEPERIRFGNSVIV